MIHYTLLNTYNRLVGETNGSSSTSKKKPSKKPYAGKFSGKIVEGDTKIMIEIVDLRAGKAKETWLEQAACLKCETKLLR